MRIRVLSVARRVPGWVGTAWTEYAARLPRELALEIVDVTPAAGNTGGPAQRMDTEAARLHKAVPRGAWTVALDARGAPWTSAGLAATLRDWQALGRDVALLIGGADGLAPAILAQADQSWSLSPLTLPHALVRVLLAEQIYRAWTINTGHPYHSGH